MLSIPIYGYPSIIHHGVQMDIYVLFTCYLRALYVKELRCFNVALTSLIRVVRIRGVGST